MRKDEMRKDDEPADADNTRLHAGPAPRRCAIRYPLK